MVTGNASHRRDYDGVGGGRQLHHRLALVGDQDRSDGARPCLAEQGRAASRWAPAGLLPRSAAARSPATRLTGGGQNGPRWRVVWPGRRVRPMTRLLLVGLVLAAVSCAKPPSEPK